MSSREGSMSPGAQDTSPDTGSGTHIGFEFVDSNDKSRIRSHAMRASWRNRAVSSPKRRTTREFPSGESSTSRTEINPRRRESRASSVEEPDIETLNGDTDQDIFLRDGVYVDTRNTLISPARRGSRGKKWRVSTRPLPSHRKPTLYQSIGEAELDPFKSTLLSLSDQTLLHHWVNVYAHQAFGQPTDPTFDPLRDLYIPVNLSHVASVHAALAHAACHMAYLRQDMNGSEQALTHKMEAIRSVNESLSDPVKCVSDENLSAVMRLVTFERYWGTEEAWTLHRKGFIQMLKKRGGVSTCSTDWRLEMRIQLISLVPKPQWNDPVFSASLRNIPLRNLDTAYSIINSYQRPHSDFLNYFEGVKLSVNDSVSHYPTIKAAIIHLRDPLEAAQEETRLKCLFYLAIIFKDSRRSQFDLTWLNDSLELTKSIWMQSLESLRWMLLQGMGRGAEDEGKMRRVEKLAHVARLLDVYPWRRMEDRLLDILMGDTVDEETDTTWNSVLFQDELLDI